MKRRGFLQLLTAGLAAAVAPKPAQAQQLAVAVRETTQPCDTWRTFSPIFPAAPDVREGDLVRFAANGEHVVRVTHSEMPIGICIDRNPLTPLVRVRTLGPSHSDLVRLPLAARPR